MAKDASELHATAFPPASARLQLLLWLLAEVWLPLAQSEVMLVKGQRLSQVEEVQRNALETASRTNDFLKALSKDDFNATNQCWLSDTR